MPRHYEEEAEETNGCSDERPARTYPSLKELGQKMVSGAIIGRKKRKQERENLLTVTRFNYLTLAERERKKKGGEKQLRFNNVLFPFDIVSCLLDSSQPARMRASNAHTILAV